MWGGCASEHSLPPPPVPRCSGCLFVRLLSRPPDPPPRGSPAVLHCRDESVAIAMSRRFVGASGSATVARLAASGQTGPTCSPSPPTRPLSADLRHPPPSVPPVHRPRQPGRPDARPTLGRPTPTPLDPSRWRVFRVLTVESLCLDGCPQTYLFNSPTVAQKLFLFPDGWAQFCLINARSCKTISTRYPLCTFTCVVCVHWVGWQPIHSTCHAPMRTQNRQVAVPGRAHTKSRPSI